MQIKPKKLHTVSLKFLQPHGPSPKIIWLKPHGPSFISFASVTNLECKHFIQIKVLKCMTDYKEGMKNTVTDYITVVVFLFLSFLKYEHTVAVYVILLN